MSTASIGRNSGVDVTINKGADDKANLNEYNPSKLARKNFSEPLVSLITQCFLGVPFTSINNTIIIIIISIYQFPA